jgi:hypothetical protein
MGRVGRRTAAGDAGGGGVNAGEEVGRRRVLLRRRPGSGVGSGRRRWVLGLGQALARCRMCVRFGRSAGRCGIGLLGGLERCGELVWAPLGAGSCRRTHSNSGDGGSLLLCMLGGPAARVEHTGRKLVLECVMASGSRLQAECPMQRLLKPVPSEKPG